MNDKFASGFAQDLESMIALKCALGYSENTYLERAKSFDRHCFEVYPGQQELTQAIVLSWLKPKPGKSPQNSPQEKSNMSIIGMSCWCTVKKLLG